MPTRHRPAPTRTPRTSRILPALALGAVLAVVANAPAAVSWRQPIHARGTTWRATLRVHTPWPESGIEAFAAAGEMPVLARTSRAVGMPGPLPDVTGLALRLPDDAALLFASTGTGRRTRRLLALRTPREVDPLTTLIPLRSRLGAVDLGAQVRGREIRLLTSLDGGPWTDRATVHLDAREHAVVRFDPLHPPAGLAWSEFWATARGPAYRLARRITPGAE